MVCPVCSSTVSGNAKFCSNCGAKLAQESLALVSGPSHDSAPAHHPAEPSDQAALELLLRNQLYVAVLAATAVSTEPALVQIRQHAQHGFDDAVQHIIAIYQRRHRSGLSSEDDTIGMLALYSVKVEGIYDSDERRAYTAALLDLASRKLAEQADPNEARTIIYAARTLMDQDAHQLRATAESLLALLNSTPDSATALAEADPTTRKLSPLDAQLPPVQQPLAASSDSLATVRLSPELTEEQPAAAPGDQASARVEVATTTSTNDHARAPVEEALTPLAAPGDEPDPALAALQQLEQVLQQRADQAQITTQLDQARALVGPDSPYFSRLARLEAQQRVLEKLPTFTALIDRPLADWLSTEHDLPGQTGALLAEVEAAFDSDAPIAYELRGQRAQRLQERTLTIEKLAGLDDLDDLDQQALREQLAELEQLLSPSFPALANAQRRRQQDQEAHDLQQQQAQAREAAAAKHDEYRQLRLKLDNLILAPLPDPSELLELRNAAEAAARDMVLTSAEHPLDPATFAYYDLYYASRYYDITRPSEKAEAGQTAVNAGDLLSAYRLFKEDLAEAFRGDNPDHRVVAQQNVQNALNNLVAKLAQNVSAALADAEERLKRFDYAAVIENLEAQRRNVQDAEVEIDAALHSRIDALLAEAAWLQQQEQQVQAYLARSAACIPGDGSVPDYPQAIALLKQALGIAPWRDAELTNQSSELQDRQARYVLGQLRRADDARRGSAYEEVERLLQRAEANVGAEQQRAEIDALRGTISKQQENQRNIERMIQAAQNLARAAEDDKNLDLLAGQVAGERERIGTRDRPNVDDATWATLNTFVALAEERLAIWRTYQRRLSQAEQAAFVGDQTRVVAAVQQLNEMTEHRFLPVETDLQRIRQVARASSRAERARQLLSDLREELETPNRSVSPERISQVLINTHGLDDPDIVDERRLLEALYPLYAARGLLTDYAAQQMFAQIKTAYDQFSPEIQQDAVVRRLAQQAELALSRQSFDDQLRALLRRIGARFEQGWDNPAGFQEAVDELLVFADKVPADQRQDLPRLAPATLEQLRNLAAQLSNARADYDRYRTQDARRRVKTILQTLPTSDVLSGNLLASYYSDLKYLREQMQEIERDLAVDKDKEYRESVQSYTACVSEIKTAFNKLELQRVLARFVNLANPVHADAISEYKTTIIRITKVVQQVNEIEDRMIGATSDAQTGQLTAQDVRRSIEAQLNAILCQSQEIQQTPRGMVWLGITDDRKYQVLREYLPLADALAGSATWLIQTTNLPRSRAKLLRLRTQVEQFQVLNLKPKDQDTLSQAGLQRLAETCQEHWLRVLKRKADLQRVLDQQKDRRNHVGRSLTAMTLFALIGVGGWSTPTVRDTVIAAAIGTLTPLPTPLPLPSATSSAMVGPTTLVVTSTPRPTETPVPTATPVPPQAGIVIIPGRANVRAQPDVRLDPITFVETGDEVQVTAFVDRGDGSRWYRLDVPGRNLRDVWLLSQITVQSRVRATVRLEGGAALRPELQIQLRP